MTTLGKANPRFSSARKASSANSTDASRQVNTLSGWTLWTTIVFVVSIAMSLDHFALFQSNIAKGLIAASTMGLLGYYVFLNRFRANRAPWPVVLWIVLMMYAMPGIMYMKLLMTRGGVAPPTLFCAATMGLLVVSAVFMPIRLLRFDPSAAMRCLACVGMVFLIGSFVVLVFFGYGLLREISVHERAFVLILPLSFAVLNRRRVLAAIALFLMAVVLLLNLRTTILLSYLCAFGMLGYHMSSKKTRLLALPFAFVFAIFFAFNGYEMVKIINASVKKNAFSSDNSSFREDVWNIGIQEFYASPIYGSFFTKGAAYDYGRKLIHEATGETLDSSLVPLHNDYLEFLVSGGIIGGVLFAAAFVGMLQLVLRNATMCRMVGCVDHMKYNQLLSTALVCAMLCMGVNPVINNTLAGFFVYGLVSLIVMEHFHLRSLGIC